MGPPTTANTLTETDPWTTLETPLLENSSCDPFGLFPRAQHNNNDNNVALEHQQISTATEETTERRNLLLETSVSVSEASSSTTPPEQFHDEFQENSRSLHWDCGRQFSTIKKFLLVGAIFVSASLLFIESMSSEYCKKSSQGHSHYPYPSPSLSPAPSLHGNNDDTPMTERWLAVSQCIQALSGWKESDWTPSSHMYHLALWFMGPGYLVPVDQNCAWGSPFANLYALLVFRDSVKVKDATWYQADQGIAVPNIDVCQWKRIQCQGGTVTGLVFNNAGLSGTLPTDVGGLVDLQHLHLFDNDGLVGHVPTELGRLLALTSLQLHQTELFGTIPTELGLLTNLQEVLLEETLLTGTMPTELCGLSRLSTLRADCQGESARVHCSCCTACH